MVLKVSVSLPGNAVITVEASEPQLYHEVGRYVALRELPMSIIQLDAGRVLEEQSLLKPPSKSVTSHVISVREARTSRKRSRRPHRALTPSTRPKKGRAPLPTSASGLSPMGDMRRVVVAAEGARRFLGMQSVSEAELETVVRHRRLATGRPAFYRLCVTRLGASSAGLNGCLGTQGTTS